MGDLCPNPSVRHLPIVASGADARYTLWELSRFARCPRSHELHHRGGQPSDTSAGRTLGRVLRDTLESAMRQHVLGGRATVLDAGHAADAYREAWACHGLGDHALFGEGLDLVARWLAREGVVDPANVLGIEQPFTLRFVPAEVLGTLPRVDRIGPDALRVRVYKSTRIPLGRRDAEESFELALLDLAARELWPWAERVELAYDLLRHDLRVTVERNDAQREATRQYVLATIAQIAQGDAHARPSPQCIHCHARAHCSAYADAFAGKRSHAGAEENDLPAVAREREELVLVLRALGERKDVLDGILRGYLDQLPDLTLDGRRYWLSTSVRKEYPLEDTVEALEEAGVSPARALRLLGSVDGPAVKEALAALEKTLPAEKVTALRAALDGFARKWPVTRLLVRELPAPGGGAR